MQLIAVDARVMFDWRVFYYHIIIIPCLGLYTLLLAVDQCKTCVILLHGLLMV